jgi:hypothetical protein
MSLSRAPIRHDAGVATFATGLRTPFARYWLSGFLADLLGRVGSLFGIVTRGTEALGAIAGGVLAATAGIRAPMLAGAPPLAIAVAVLGRGTTVVGRRAHYRAWRVRARR